MAFFPNKQSSTNRRLTELLIEKDIGTFCFDWYGMGESEGTFADLTVGICCDELEQALSFVRAKGYTRIGVVGSSYGGLIATLIASRDSSLAALGLKCPVPDFPEMVRLEFGPEAMDRLQSTGEFIVSRFVVEYRLRIGPYRVLYDIADQRKKVILLKLMKHDKKTYNY